jgi:uncharacterized protein
MTGPASTHRIDDRTLRRAGLWLSAALLLWSLVANLGLGERLYLTRNLVLGVLVLALARQVGLTTTELGLGRAQLGKGARWGVAAVAVVAFALTLGVALADRVAPIAALLADQRANMSTPELIYQATVRIPLGTALFEELVFRGVLLALLARQAGTWRATVLSSVVFGLWHVAPTIVTLRINDVPPTSAAGIGAIVSTVLVTVVAGVLFCLLRWRSGSLLAPVLAHWATNALALLAAAAATGTD